MNFFNNLPQPVKVIIPFVLLGLVSAGIITSGDMKNIFPDEKEDVQTQNYIDIGFVVRDEQNNPLENVKVSFQGSNFVTERVTNSDGYIKLSLPDQEDIEIVMIKETYMTKRINFNTNVDRGKTITYFLKKLNEISTNDNTLTNNTAQSKCFEATTIDNFEISLRQCEQSGSTIVLYLDIKNLGRSRNITLYAHQSRIINSGHYYYAVNTYIGQPSWRANSQERIPHGITVKAAFKFEDIVVNQNDKFFIELNTSISKIEFAKKSIGTI